MIPHAQRLAHVSDPVLTGRPGAQGAALASAGSPVAAFQAGSSANLRAHPRDVLVMPGRGLRLPQQLPFERWLRVGRQLAGIYSSSAWCLGDWLVYGEMAYQDRYREAIERTSLDYQTLRNYAWVARRFSLSRRQDSLSFGHHAEVAALPEAEQDFWLRKVQQFGWSVKRLRHEVRTSHIQRSASDDTQPTQIPGRSRGPAARIDIHITPEQLQAYEAAADKANLALKEWAALALDRAAGRA
jgi:hypothetical protein